MNIGTCTVYMCMRKINEDMMSQDVHTYIPIYVYIYICLFV